jgi:hypothetical protein
MKKDSFIKQTINIYVLGFKIKKTLNSVLDSSLYFA